MFLNAYCVYICNTSVLYILCCFCTRTTHVYGHVDHIGQCPSRNEANKSLATLAVSSFDIPGDTRFPLNAFMTKPSNRGESGKCMCMYTKERRVYSS